MSLVFVASKIFGGKSQPSSARPVKNVQEAKAAWAAFSQAARGGAR